MKYALCLRGISFQRKYQHWAAGEHDIDYADTCANIHQRIVDDLRANGHTVDIFLATYKNEKQSQIINDFEPQGSIFSDPFPDMSAHQCIAVNTLLCLELIKRSQEREGTRYDQIIITRFDAAFSENFGALNIDKEKFNFLCRAEKTSPQLVDDNLWVLPAKFLDPFRDVLSEVASGMYWGHELLPHLTERIGDNVNFMYEGHFVIQQSRPLIKFARELKIPTTNP